MNQDKDKQGQVMWFDSDKDYDEYVRQARAEETELASAKEESLNLFVGHPKWLDWLKNKGF